MTNARLQVLRLPAVARQKSHFEPKMARLTFAAERLELPSRYARLFACA
jgi:hypothetical protein